MDSSRKQSTCSRYGFFYSVTHLATLLEYNKEDVVNLKVLRETLNWY